MRGSRIGWAMGIVAPWCIGIGFLVSITADAGQDAAIGASLAPLSMRAPSPPAVLIPATSPAFTGDFGKFSGETERLMRQASLVFGEGQGFGQGFQRLPDEIEPRAELKRHAGAFPVIDRTHRGDPMVGLRPTFDTRLRGPGGLANLRAHDLIFNHDDTWPISGFSPSEGDASFDGDAGFEPWPDGETPTTTPSRADASPRQAGSTMTMRPAALNERLMQGATPATPRATALASTTPAPADSIPVEVVSLPGAPRPDMSARPNYAALIDQDNAGREKRCLAEAIYFEARSEPEEGQAAVAQVVLNRASSGLYPASICGVVYQNRQRYHGCQFSFACEGKSLRINEPDAWHTAVRIAEAVSQGKTYLSDVGGSTHYHANYVRPRWAKALKKMDIIGHHIFYKLRPGQT